MDGDKRSDGFGRRGMESGRDGFAPEIDVCHFRKIINKKLDCILNASFIKGKWFFFSTRNWFIDKKIRFYRFIDNRTWFRNWIKLGQKLNSILKFYS